MTTAPITPPEMSDEPPPLSPDMPIDPGNPPIYYTPPDNPEDVPNGWILVRKTTPEGTDYWTLEPVPSPMGAAVPKTGGDPGSIWDKWGPPVLSLATLGIFIRRRYQKKHKA
jgi:hypothetical protein